MSNFPQFVFRVSGSGFTSLIETSCIFYTVAFNRAISFTVGGNHIHRHNVSSKLVMCIVYQKPNRHLQLKIRWIHWEIRQFWFLNELVQRLVAVKILRNKATNQWFLLFIRFVANLLIKIALKMIMTPVRGKQLSTFYLIINSEYAEHPSDLAARRSPGTPYRRENGIYLLTNY